MCGLAGGISSFLSLPERDVIKDLIWLNMYRGTHSSGMFDYVEDTKKLEKPYKENSLFWKSTQHPFNFVMDICDKVETERWKEGMPSVIAAHTRHATIGKISRQNAHPFNHKNIIGMHNGTILGNFKNREKFETDSEALYYNIANLGFEEAIEEVQNFSPSYALVWMDTAENKVHFYRNEKRPLHFAMMGGSTAYWSSEKITLDFVLSQHNMKPSKVEAFETETLYTVDMNKPGLDIAKKVFRPKKWYATTSYTSTAIGARSAITPGSGIGTSRTYRPTDDRTSSEYLCDFYGALNETPHYKVRDPVTNKWFSEHIWDDIVRARQRETRERITETFDKETKSRVEAELNDPPFDKDDTRTDKESSASTTTTTNNSVGHTGSIKESSKSKTYGVFSLDLPQPYSTWLYDNKLKCVMAYDSEIEAWVKYGIFDSKGEFVAYKDLPTEQAKQTIQDLSSRRKLGKAQRRSLRKARATIREAKKAYSGPPEADEDKVKAIVDKAEEEMHAFIVNGKFVSEEDFYSAINRGCGYCGDPVGFWDNILWMNDDDLLCEDCSAEMEANPDHPAFEFPFYSNHKFEDALKRRKEFRMLHNLNTKQCH